MIKHLTLATMVSIALAWAFPAAAQKVEGGPAEFKALKYRLVGPFIGGRVCRSAGVPGDPLTYYAAAASGGIWKSTDGGFNWKPIFDDQLVASIGSIAVAPADANVLYAGTGEGNIRGNVVAGNGIYKSVDAGKSWQQVWKQEGQIGALIVHPTNADIAFAAVFGRAFGPSAERGVYRTTDGGKSWQRVLFKDQDTGAADVCFDASNPNILFAGLWQARRRPWTFTSGGPGSGLYTSRDGGATWKQLTGKGLPDGLWGKIGVAVAPSDGRRVYALIEAEQGGLFRSDDGGDTWKRINGHHYLRQRPWYFSTLTVDPTNPDVLWCPTVRLLKSIDGGKTFVQVKGPHHGDHHDLWIDPRNPRRMIDSNDGGVDLTLDGRTWYAPPLPLAQFYHVAVDNHVPYRVSGTMQDLGTGSGPSNSLSSDGITQQDWHEIGGGETGFTAPDPVDPDIIYAGEYGGYISRYDERTRQAHNVSIYPINPSGHGAEDLRYRFAWTAPILVSRHDPHVVYHGANVLFRTSDGGKSWSAISPDLTRNDRSKQTWSGGPITGDNTGAEYFDTLFAIAESPCRRGLIWVGSDDGLVHVTSDGGKSWTNVSANLPGLPEWGTVSAIEPSPFDAGTAYVVIDAHRLDDSHPYLFKTSDLGKTWKSLSAKLPPEVYLHVVREDPQRQGLLYVGSERGVSFSTDDGASWRELKLNLPTVAVHDLVVKNDDLVVGTHGRSIWILDDLTPLRRMSAAQAEVDVHLFASPPAVRWRFHSAFHEKGPGENPPSGMIIDYYLKKKPQGRITLEVLDAQGMVVRQLSSVHEPAVAATPLSKVEHGTPETKPPARSESVARGEPEPENEDEPDAPEEPPKKAVLTTEPGVNRVAWDLRYQEPETIKNAKMDMPDVVTGPLVNPGTYTLRLTVEGKTVTMPATVQPDPRVQLAPAELDEQLKLALAVRENVTRLSRLVGRLRSVRDQLSARDELCKEQPKTEPVVRQGESLIDKLNALEGRLHNPRAEVTYDILAQRGGAQLYSQLTALLEWIENADGGPTQGMREVYAEEARTLQQDEAELEKLVSSDLARLNDTARKLDVPNIIVPGGLPAPARQP